MSETMAKKFAKLGSIIEYDDVFWKSFRKFLFDKKFSVFLKMLNEPKFRLDKHDFSYRMINHWENFGLIRSFRPSEKGWRKYSLVDFVWINIILELRSFGLSLEWIKKIRENYLIWNETKPVIGSEFICLEYYIFLALNKIPVYILAFNTGEAYFATQKQFRISTEKRLIGNHINININEIMYPLFPNMNLIPDYVKQIPLTDEEFFLIFMIRLERWESIMVKMKDGRIERLEATESINTEKRIAEILKDADYQDIEIKKVDGKIVSIHRTIKQKLN